VYRDNIRSIYEHLSPGYRRIADFMLTRYQDAAFMTAAEVARAAAVDTALVVRFAQRLGYPGYPELINDVQEDVKRDLRAVYEPLEGDDSPGQMLRRVLTQDRNNLEYVHLHLNVEMVDRVVETLLAANRLFVAGEGNSLYLAEAFVKRLQMTGLWAYLLSREMAEQAAQITSIRPGDVYLGLGLTAVTPNVAVVLKLARTAGAKTIAIVGSPALPVAAAAELILEAPAQSMGLLPSWTAMAAILHSLSHVLARRQGEPSPERLLSSERYLAAYSEMMRQNLSTVSDAARLHSAKEQQGLSSGGPL
jgi:DNA-binding MurR/RpiR family transcriptional regulator